MYKSLVREETNKGGSINLKFMNENLTPFKNSRTGKIVFILSIIVSGFWWLGQVINVYNIALVGAIFELLWLPMLAMLFTLPIISLIYTLFVMLE
jgi:hypothetical protein